MIQANETVITAYAEAASGPGWGNAPLWIVVRDQYGKLRIECLQPHDQTDAMQALYAVSAAAHQSMTAEVRAHPNGRRKRASEDRP